MPHLSWPSSTSSSSSPWTILCRSCSLPSSCPGRQPSWWVPGPSWVQVRCLNRILVTYSSLWPLPSRRYRYRSPPAHLWWPYVSVPLPLASSLLPAIVACIHSLISAPLTFVVPAMPLLPPLVIAGKAPVIILAINHLCLSSYRSILPFLPLPSTNRQRSTAVVLTVELSPSPLLYVAGRWVPPVRWPVNALNHI